MSILRLLPVLLCVLAVGCGFKHSKADTERGRKALTAALDGWKDNQPPDALRSLPDPVEFTDELRRSHRLVEYSVGEPDRTDPEVLRYPVTLTLQETKAKGKTEDRRVVFMVALKSPVTIARDPYE